MHQDRPTALVLKALIVAFGCLTVAFLLNLWGNSPPLPFIPVVDASFTNTSPNRVSIAERLRAGDDSPTLDCYLCHDKKVALKLRFDANNNIVVPEEHQDIVMGHGRHNRNNNCFNCHDERNLQVLQTRDGRELKLAESTPLCGSCHGPTYRDWDAGIHGRTSGYWDRSLGPIIRLDCVSCHNPHAPKFQGRKPAPGPHLLHPVAHSAGEPERNP